MSSWLTYVLLSCYLCGLAWHIQATSYVLDKHKAEWTFTRAYMVALWPLLMAEIGLDIIRNRIRGEEP